MRDKLDALEELAHADLAYRQIDVELAEVEQHLAGLRAAVEKMRELLDIDRGKIAETERSYAAAQSALEDIAEKTLRSKKRNDGAKTNRELEATSRELEILKREKDERTTESQKLLEIVQQIRESIARHEADFAMLTEELKTEENASRHRTEGLLGRKRDAEADRKALTSKLPPELLRIYTMVFNRKGNAVAEVIAGICRGCHMALPPQLNNQIIRGDKIYQCPSCQRILLLRNATART